MAVMQQLTLSIALPYPQAGVEFRLTGACQDGTIQLLTWKENPSKEKGGIDFPDLSSFKVIVDGPLVTLQLQSYPNYLRVVIGSLCGYVCQLVRPTTSLNSTSWEGPSMIVEGFWNEALESDDSRSGRCW